VNGCSNFVLFAIQVLREVLSKSEDKSDRRRHKCRLIVKWLFPEGVN